MDDDEDNFNRSNSIQSQPTLQRQDDQKIISTSTEKSNSNRRRVRVKYAYSFDDDRVVPIAQTTLVQTEPYFKVIATEDQATKQFYQNKAKKQEIPPLIEADSLDEEYPAPSTKEKEGASKISDVQKWVTHQTTPPSTLKSILKKPKKKEQEQEKPFKPKLDESVKSPLHSLPSTKKKDLSSTRLDFNEVQHLAEITAKQNPPSPSIHTRSLFDQTINIFDPNNSYRITSNAPHPARLQYYIKPYRGDPKELTNWNKQQLRQTLSTKHIQPVSKQSERNQHVSWSPSRNSTVILPIREERISSPSLSLNNPSLETLPPIQPVSVHHRLSRIPVHSFSRDTPSVTSQSQYPSKKEEHDETMKRYDRLLERIRTTDEELQSLSRSWSNSIQQSTSVRANRRSSVTLNKMTRENALFSPMIIQLCLIILVIFNLMIVYFFNEINLWWSENIAPGMVVERQHEAFLNF